MKRSTAYPKGLLLWTGFAAGLILRCSMLSYVGVYDMGAYFEWGLKALESGLTKYYHGTYFPLQYQIFELCAWIAARMGLSQEHLIFVFKLSNLVFDVPAFFLLILLLKRQGSNPAYALMYWLHPWFLSVFSLGYIDFQFACLVLLSVYFLRSDAAADFLLSGIPLGLAFVMKPQALILIVAAFFYVSHHYARTRDIRPVGIFAGSILFFVGYEVFFTVSRFPELGYGAIKILWLTYYKTTDVYPCLTCQMLNIWYPIAYFMKRPGDPISAVSDQIVLLSHVPLRLIVEVMTLYVVASHVFRVEKNHEMTVSDKFIGMFGVAALTAPFLMTSAHENHLFLGSIFLVLLLAADYPVSFKIACHVLLVIQFLNIYGLYGQHPASIAQTLRNAYSEDLAVVYSLTGVICFLSIRTQLALKAITVRYAGVQPSRSLLTESPPKESLGQARSES